MAKRQIIQVSLNIGAMKEALAAGKVSRSFETPFKRLIEWVEQDHVLFEGYLTSKPKLGPQRKTAIYFVFSEQLVIDGCSIPQVLKEFVVWVSQK